MKKARRRFTRAFKTVPFGLFTTEHTEARFAGRGRQFEKYSFGFGTGNPPVSLDFGRGTDGRAKRKFPIAFRVRRSRFPGVPW